MNPATVLLFLIAGLIIMLKIESQIKYDGLVQCLRSASYTREMSPQEYFDTIDFCLNPLTP